MQDSTKKLRAKKKWYSIKLFLMIIPFLVLVFLFSYFPLHGWAYALFDYRPPFKLKDCDYVGFKWFTTLFTNASKRRMILQVMKNTFVMSGLHIVFSWIPMAFAILLNEVKCVPYKKVVQTLTTLPHFISWVLVYTLAFSLLSSSGAVNTLAIQSGWYDTPKLFLQDSEHTYLFMWLLGLWKGTGWSAIMYIAAIAGIDAELYDAAYVDGANRFQTIWHITVPSLLPTYFVLLLLNVASFLNNGVEQYYVFQNSFNLSKIQVLDLYVYNLGLGNGSYSLATAISIMKSFVSLTLLFSVNALSKALRGDSIL